jgi:hypothetical protein
LAHADLELAADDGDIADVVPAAVPNGAVVNDPVGLGAGQLD